MKYKTIAEQIVNDIQSHKLKRGQRLPSLRQLSKQLDVSMTTALNSYRSLEQMGWVVTRPKSGFFVSTPLNYTDLPKQPQFQSSLKGVPKSIKPDARQNHKTTSGPLGESQLSPHLLNLTSFTRSIKRTAHQRGELLQSYADPKGRLELRQAITDHYRSNGFVIDVENLVISGGCMDAVRMALRATTQPGDAVAISSPCFNGLLELLENLSLLVVEIPCNTDGIDITQLEAKFKNKEVSAALFSSAHMNPHGISLSSTQKQQIAALANKYQTPIIEDDVYGDLGFDHTFVRPIKQWDNSGYVLWCSSVSKTLASGLRIGWCLAGRYLDVCVNTSKIEHLGHNGLMQASLADFINTGHYAKHLRTVQAAASINADDYRRLLLSKLPKGAAVSAPNGGLVLWVQVPRLDSVKLSSLTAKANMDIRFGAQFTSRQLYRDCFRINFGWALCDQHDEQHTIEQTLLRLCLLVKRSLKKQTIKRLR